MYANENWIAESKTTCLHITVHIHFVKQTI